VAAPDANKVIMGTGVLAADGTALGVVANVVLRVPSMSKVLLQEEDNSAVKVVHLGGPLILGCRLYGWESDAVSKLVPGGSSGPNVVFPFGEGLEPTVIASLTFTPVKVGYPKVTLLNAYSLVEREMEMDFSAYQYVSYTVAIVATGGGSIAPKT
jgi:hypothetical protein